MPVSSVGGPAGGTYAPPGSNGGATSPPLGFGSGPSNTLDEPVWDTIKRDLLRIYKNLVSEWDGGCCFCERLRAARCGSRQPAAVLGCCMGLLLPAQRGCWRTVAGSHWGCPVCCAARAAPGRSFRRMRLHAAGHGGVPLQGPQPAVGGSTQLGPGETLRSTTGLGARYACAAGRSWYGCIVDCAAALRLLQDPCMHCWPWLVPPSFQTHGCLAALLAWLHCSGAP